MWNKILTHRYRGFLLGTLPGLGFFAWVHIAGFEVASASSIYVPLFILVWFLAALGWQITRADGVRFRRDEAERSRQPWE